MNIFRPLILQRMNKQMKRGAKNSEQTAQDNVAPKGNALSSTKAPPRKYGAHAGLKFNFTFKKDPTRRLHSFDGLTENQKGNGSSISRKTFEKQASMDMNIKSVDEVEKCVENLKISKTPDGAANVLVRERSGEASDGAAILSENEEAFMCDIVVKSLDVINPLAQTSKTVTSKIPRIMKPQLTPETSKALKVPSSNAVETPQKSEDLQRLSKIQSTKFSKPQTSITETDAKVHHKKYGEHAGLKLRLHANGKKKTTVVQPFSFENRAPSPKNKSENADRVQTQSKVGCTEDRIHQKK